MKLIKTLLFIQLILSLSIAAFAQKNDKSKKQWASSVKSSNLLNRNSAPAYNFAVTTNPYSNLSGATSLSNNQLWDDTTYNVSIGFGFSFFDQVFTDLDIYTDGVIGKILAPDSVLEYSLAPYVADLQDRGYITGNPVSNISYKLEGSSPNRILKIEFKNAGFFEEEDVLNSQNWFTNFQLWIFETSNKIEYHYGPTTVSNINIAFFGESGPIVGLGFFNSITGSLSLLNTLQGSPAAPTLVDSVAYLVGIPANGTVYRFTKIPTGIANSYQQNSKVRTYPNPAFEEINLSYSLPQEAKNASVILYDLLGKEIQRQQLFGIEGAAVISLKDLAEGTYLYKVLSSETGMLANGKLVVSK